MHRHLMSVVSFSSAFVLVACQEPETDDPSISWSEGLAVYAGNNLWNTNGNVVKICWVTTGMATQKDQIKDAITAGWAAYSGLTFTWPANPGTDICPSVPGQPTKVPNAYMPISLLNDGGFGGSCNAGVGARNSAADCQASMECECLIHYGAAGDPSHPNPTAWLKWGAQHEIGHGLGLPHEHQRTDRPADIMTTCVDGWTDDANHAKDPTFRLLTQYDGLNSILSYCADVNRDGLRDDPPSIVLSALDQLGIEMLYPRNLGRRPILSGAITTAQDGSQALVRSDVTYTINPDWIARGGLVSALSGYQWADQNFTVFSTNPSLSLSFSASRIIQLKLTDTLGSVHPFTPVTVTPNNSLFTAIAQTSPIFL